LSQKTSLIRILKLMAIFSVMALTASIALAQSGASPNRGELTRGPLPAYIQGAKLDAPVSVDGGRLHRLNDALVDASGPQKVVVRLTRPSLSEFVARGGRAADEAAALDAVSTQQEAVIAAAGALDANAKVLARTRLASNTIMLKIDAAALEALAANPNVARINPVVNYELDLSETVPYIGASAVQDMGYDGSGVKVAILDSGVDYTHAAFGGPGTLEAYAAAYGADPSDPLNTTRDGLFPTDKVVEGYDFVGETWGFVGGAEVGEETPDPDPIDFEGHGTHVADIIGGELGVAPGADLYAVKVCSAISSTCSGVALMQAMDYALDPNDDGNMDDKMDIIHMSLGSNMGNPISTTSPLAVENASGVGVLTVASAGNGGDLPYIHGTPASAPSALAVAQTAVPSAIQPVMEVTAPESIAGQYAAVFQPWSAPLDAVVTGNLIYGDSDGDNLDGCAAFTGNINNRIVLVDRGGCTFSLKISNIADGGARAGIIGLIAPGDPFEGGLGDGDNYGAIPGFMISQANANILKQGLDEGNVAIRFDPADGLPLVQTIVGSSSRGPSFALNQAKPDIGAPGASISAVVGTGTATEPFGGTSGAAPMVSGSAALLMQAYPDRSWAEIKAVLMNTAETEITTGPELFGGILAPISRIGGGEVRVDRAVATSLAAWDKQNLTGSLSFGFHDITDGAEFSRDVILYNYSDEAVTLSTDVEHRYDNDAGGEVTVTLPATVNVPANGATTVKVQLVVEQDEATLHPWEMNSGSQATNPAALTLNEYDGYIRFMDEANEDNAIHMAWHILPRAAGDVMTGVMDDMPYVQNMGKADTYIDTYSLLAVSKRLEESEQPGGNRLFPDIQYVGVQTYPVPADFCGPEESFVMGFAVTTYDRSTQAAPTSFEFWLDTDNDGTDDYVVYNTPLAFASDIRNVTVVFDFAAGEGTPFFFLVHNTNSANNVLLFCGDQIGMNTEDFLKTSMGVTVRAWDYYFSGEYSDEIAGLNVVPLGERFFTVFEDDNFGYVELPPLSEKVGFEVEDYEDQLNETEVGLLWLYGPGAPSYNENKAWILTEQEVMLYMPAIAAP